MTEYTSEQYKYLLLRHLQRHFSFETEYDRCYTYTFYSQLLEGITITKEHYENFLNVLYTDLKYCVDHSYEAISDLSDVDIELHQSQLIDAFKRIAIKLEIVENDKSGRDLIFTKTDSSVLVYSVGDGKHDFLIKPSFTRVWSPPRFRESC